MSETKKDAKDHGTKRGRSDEDVAEAHKYGGKAVPVRVSAPVASVFASATDTEVKSEVPLSTADMFKGNNVDVNVFMDDDKKWHWKQGVLANISAGAGAAKTLRIHVRELPEGKKIMQELSTSTRLAPKGTYVQDNGGHSTSAPRSASESGSGSGSGSSMGLGGTPSSSKSATARKMDTTED